MNQIFFQQNRNNFFQQMDSQSLALFYSGQVFFKTNDLPFPFEVNRNFYYLTGLQQTKMILILIKNIQFNQMFLFFEKNNSQKALWDGPTLSCEEVSYISGISKEFFLDIKTYENFFSNFFVLEGRNFLLEPIKQVYFDLSGQFLNQELNFNTKQANKIASYYPHLKIKNSFSIISNLRKIKSKKEIQNIQKAITINKKILEKLVTKIKPGIYEYQINAFYDFLLANQNLKSSFETIVASGKNATILHYQKQTDMLKENELVLLDLGVSYQKYNSDISRCYPINGTFTQQQKKFYEIVLKTNKILIDWVKAGNTFLELNNYAKKILFEELKKIGFLKKEEELKKYYYHGVCHYLGLDVHDIGDVSQPILENSIITIEPGLYIEHLNIGIRIEDNILIQKKKSLNLTSTIVKEVDEIEKLMKKY